MKNKIKNYELNDKVDNFIDWCKKNVSDYYGSTDKIRNFIEKMAVWYELRYPDYEINKIMPCVDQEDKSVTEEMFYNNDSIKYILNSYNSKNEVEWSNFYDKESFIKTLPNYESIYLDTPGYAQLIYVTINGIQTHFHIKNNGIIDEAEQVGLALKYKMHDIQFKGMHIEIVLEILNTLKVKLPKNNAIEYSIKAYENEKYFKEQLLNCVMYRIIERGGNRIGPRRGLMFAKEFNCNINIPMIYGIDYSDPWLFNFILEYIKSGGDKDLVCIVGYGKRESKNKLLDTISLRELVNSAYTNYILLDNNPDEVISKQQRELFDILEKLNNLYKVNKVKKLKRDINY